MSFVVSPSFTLRTDVQRPQMPAKKASGRVSSSANQTGGREPSGRTSCSAKLVNGTTQRLSAPSHRRQWGEATLRILVTPGSDFRPFSANAGEVADRLLAFGDAVEIAHGAQRLTAAWAAQRAARARGMIHGHGAKAYREPGQRERDMIPPDRPALDTPLARLCGRAAQLDGKDDGREGGANERRRHV